MATANSDSSLDPIAEPVPIGEPGADAPLSAASGGIHLDGDVLACTCPECGTPMSIRLWLMVADCWRCGTSIELSEEQEQEALRLLRQREDSRRADTHQAVATIAPTVGRPTTPGSTPPLLPSRDVPTEPQPEPAPRGTRRVAAWRTHRGARARIRKLHEEGSVGVLWSDLFDNLPAWLVSLVVHLVAILLLGLWIDQPADDAHMITLATTVGEEDLAGDLDDPLDALTDGFEFDDPGAIDLDDITEAIEPVGREEVLLEAGPGVEIHDPLGNVPDFAVQPPVSLPMAPTGQMFAGRDPTLRAQMVRQSGGSSFTEVAVARGLKFLARHQNRDGSWSLHAFHKGGDCDGSCSGQGSVRSDMAATALALLPFLGAGQTHLEGEYANTVFNGLKWMIDAQGDRGDLRGRGQGRMYAHGQAAIVLCEAYAMTGDEQLRAPAQLSLDYIIRAQHNRGGWRYQPKEPGDTSVLGWQLMALRSGQMAYLYVSPKAFELAGLYLDRAKTDKIGAKYAYMPRQRTSHVMTAEALLCRQYLGWPKNHPGLRAGVNFLLKKHPPKKDEPNIYYWYYATQVMHHVGGSDWNRWNAQMRQVLVGTQEKEGHQAGSWAPRGAHASRGGRIYMTSLAVCTLEVYYRHLPIFQEQSAKDPAH